jgi:hemoglobin
LKVLNDIETKNDIYFLVKQFYSKLIFDPTLAHFFEKFKNDTVLEEHLAVLVDFWDGILFYTNAYQNNAMQPHLNLNKTKPFLNQHFDKWLEHFNQTVDTYFKGERAHAAKTRALSIATVMKIKMSNTDKS